MKPQLKVEIENKENAERTFHSYKQNHATKCEMPEKKYTIFQRDQFKFTIKEVDGLI